MAYVINHDDFKSMGIHWIALYVNANKAVSFDIFGVEHVSKEIKNFLGNKNITTNIFRIKAYNSVTYGYFCIGFINFTLKAKSLVEHTNLFSPDDYGKNDKIIDKIILKYIQ